MTPPILPEHPPKGIPTHNSVHFPLAMYFFLTCSNPHPLSSPTRILNFTHTFFTKLFTLHSLKLTITTSKYFFHPFTSSAHVPMTLHSFIYATIAFTLPSCNATCHSQIIQQGRSVCIGKMWRLFCHGYLFEGKFQEGVWCQV